MLHVISVEQWSSNLIIIAHTYSSFFYLLCRPTFYYIYVIWYIAYQTLTKQFLMANYYVMILSENLLQLPIGHIWVPILRSSEKEFWKEDYNSKGQIQSISTTYIQCQSYVFKTYSRDHHLLFFKWARIRIT